MTEVLFYHLQTMSLENVLPPLLEKSLERGWRVVVQSTSPERAEALDAHLWTYRDDSFLPHAAWRGGDAEDQPIVLVVNGGDDDALAAARGAWTDCKARGFEVSYWQADERGRWQRRE